MQILPANNFWQFEPTYWFQQLNATDKGLSQVEANKKLLQSPHHKKTKSSFEKDLGLFIGQFKSPLMLLLIGAVILSAFLGDTSDVFIILFIVISTGLMSFFQERNAGKVVEKLQSMISLKSNVLRDGEVQQVDSSNIVAGDILLFKAGDMIPADCLLIEANELHVNESSLTGESYPVRKEVGILAEHTELAKRTNCLWEGSNIVSGNAKALVINTGTDTIFGSIAQSINTIKETTFEKGIKDFGYFLMKITLVLSFFILIVNLVNHKSVIDSALFALALAVGMAPELLPAITTIAMSAGAKRMLEKKVIVKKLASIQNLGEVNLLCTDKTGTITEGAIKVAGLLDGFGEQSEFVKLLAFWNASFETGYTNPIDEALKGLNLKPEETVKKIGEVPYDFIRKRLSIAVQTNSESLLICKGAFTQIFNICSKVKLTNGSIADLSDYQTVIEQKFEEFGLSGMRAIGLCYKNIEKDDISKEDEKDMIFAGFVLLQDPVKEGIIETIDELKKLAVNLKIITGDNKNVAKSIALSIGIKNPVVMTGESLINTSPEALKLLVKKTHIFAEVEPQQKERIILALRKTYTVAYMGDGINDVSAINAADVGISVENAVDVAREAADFVLLEKNLMVVVDGIKEGRKTFANTLKYIFINTGSTFGNMFSVAIASLLLPFLPMLPKQILLTNFITDFPYLTVASDNVDQEQLNKPGKWDLKFIRNYMVIFGIHSSLFDVITFLTLLYVLKVKESAFQTAWFIESILTELFILFIIRTHKNFFKSKPGSYLFILSIVGLVLTIAMPYLPFANEVGLVPLPFLNLGLMLLIVATYIITADLLKVWFFKKYRSN
ncbi:MULTISPECIES: magnesium-translocating P-type ATPase [unclassified Arcicella]|uniref:magnesium-translocating P-type ATPase n=1 Tax=unclassified Arcicella TaxID=2644986 RepID=UPI00286782BC|nr:MULTISPECIES: magnesium-translocating P-type ATPase [unclassified Arcicella]MDR6564286.1 Mg2+-importing ATPase [Arcicella sp. BE51]MDR6811467.1 Mg2+-importing ATPase [Arcicella sp. BE140]MDR6826007.1 Mg2+-importing ATPase [Arcicella sp. BE139]